MTERPWHRGRNLESDNAPDGVIWKARDLWSASVERSSYGTSGHDSEESRQPRAATGCGHPPAGGCCSSSVMQPAIVNELARGRGAEQMRYLTAWSWRGMRRKRDLCSWCKQLTSLYIRATS